MKLALSVLGQHIFKLVKGKRSDQDAPPPHAFCVVALLSDETGADSKPVILGRSETIPNSRSPDFCHMFIIEDYQLGKPLKFVVSVHDDAAAADSSKSGNKKNNNNSKNQAKPCFGSAIFEVGAVLSAPGSTMGKEITQSTPLIASSSSSPIVAGMIMVNLERYTGSGTLSLQLKGENLTNTEGNGVFNKSDPFFELQRKRRVIVRKKREGSEDIQDEQQRQEDDLETLLWDCVFRSRPIQNNLNPRWSDTACIELSALCHKGNLDDFFRIAVYDYDENSAHDYMGACNVTVDKVLQAASYGDTFFLKKGRTNVGSIAVISAFTKGIPEPVAGSSESPPSKVDTPVDDKQKEDEEVEIVVNPTSAEGETEFELSFGDDATSSGNDIVILADELDPPSFVDYIRGGCELKVAVAIDFTASNGDPRKEESLHYFHRSGSAEHNDYETAMEQICSILAEYDTDQMFPVWGFGAKVNGQVSHCFSCRDPSGSSQATDMSEKETQQGAEVNGVSGILETYKGAFKSGIAMSQPTDMTHVIEAASKHARRDLDDALQEGRQAYSVLLIFTNGAVDSMENTIKAIDAAQDEPLSIVIIGVGPSDFSAIKEAIQNGGGNQRRDFVRFVDMKEHKAATTDLASTSLKEIPDQMVRYLLRHDIQPNPSKAEEIAIQPFNASESKAVQVTVSTNGEISVKNPSGTTTTNVASPSSAFAEEAAASSGGSGQVGGKVGKSTKDEVMKQGKRIFSRQKRTFGRLQKQYQKKVDKLVDSKIKNMLPKFK